MKSLVKSPVTSPPKQNVKRTMTRWIAGAGCVLALVAGPARAAGPVLTWEQAFPLAAAAPRVHFTARYRDAADREHALEVWRDGTRFLHRRTDAQLDLYAAPKDAAQREVSYRLIDHVHRSVYDVDRSNLYRIGVFSDWAALAHVLDRPKGAYSVRATTAPAGLALAGCRWRVIEPRAGAASRVCWSARWGLPLAIVGDDPAPPRFRVVAVESMAATRVPEGLAPLPAGYNLYDGNEEIAPD